MPTNPETSKPKKSNLQPKDVLPSSGKKSSETSTFNDVFGENVSTIQKSPRETNLPNQTIDSYNDFFPESVIASSTSLNQSMEFDSFFENDVTKNSPQINSRNIENPSPKKLVSVSDDFFDFSEESISFSTSERIKQAKIACRLR